GAARSGLIQQILCAFSRCNAHHALVLSAAAKRPRLRLKFLQRSVCTRNSGLNTLVIFFWACAPWRLRIQPSKIRDFVPSDRPPPPREKSAFCFSASARGRPCSDLSRALRAVHGAQTAKIL